MRAEPAAQLRMPAVRWQGVPGRAARSGADRDRAVVRFASLQFFAMIYLQKIALGPASAQVSVPMIFMVISIAWMLATHKIGVSPLRLILFLIFLCFSLFAQVLSQMLGGSIGSIPSYLEVVLIYASLTITTEMNQAEFQRQVCDRFVKYMILPAVIILVQYWYQKLTGRADPIDMDAMLPKSLLLQGFYYNMHYPWNSTFSRPNGFFFLEPSTVSMFTAAAAVIELLHFRRFRYVLLMIAGTIFSIGGTGFTVLAIALPLILMRDVPPHLFVIVLVVSIIALAGANALDIPLPLSSRLKELDDPNASGSLRLIIPASLFVDHLLDPTYLISGGGPGSALLSEFGSPWPLLKIAHEYGMLSMFAFAAFYLSAMLSNRENIPLKVAISVIFHFTGGYLMDSFIANFLAILCMTRAPAPKDRRYRAWPTVADVRG